jgi:predicted permease
LREEIETHLESLAREYRESGFSPEDADRAARRRFGSLTKVHEDCRENFMFGAIETVLRDVRYGVRGLRKTPVFVLVATLSLGLGIGVNLVVYSLFQAIFLGTPTAAEPDRLVRLRLDQNSHTSFPIVAALQRSDAALAITGYRDMQLNWRDGDGTVDIFAQVVTPNFFHVVGGHPSFGRLFASQEVSVTKPARVVVISYGFWRRRLASAADVLSRTLTINGLPYSVIGVLPKGYRSIIGFNVVPDFYLPVTTELFPNLLDSRDSLDLAMIARLDEGQSTEQARASLVAAARHIGAEFAPDNPRFGRLWQIQGIRDIDQIQSKQGNVLIFFSILLLVLVGLVLFVACANVAGLLLVRGSTRNREIAIRLAIGAGRWHIVRQLLTEGIALAALGCISGILMWRTAAVFLENVELPMPVPLVFQISANIRMLVSAFALGALSTLLSSLGPALQATKQRFLSALKSEQFNLGNRHLTLRNVLVASQISVCFVLLVSAILFFGSINRAKEVKTGFDVNHTISVRLREPNRLRKNVYIRRK